MESARSPFGQVFVSIPLARGRAPQPQPQQQTEVVGHPSMYLTVGAGTSAVTAVDDWAQSRDAWMGQP